MYSSQAWTHFVPEDDLELFNILPPPLQSWGYRHAPPYPVFTTLAIKHRDSLMLGKHSTFEFHFQGPH